MNTVALEVFNDNSISYIAGSCFIALFGFLGIIAKGIFDSRAKTRELTAITEEAKDEANQAHKSAKKAQENTASVSNGFVGRMDDNFGRLFDDMQRLSTKTDHIDDAIRKHLQWHIDKETQK